MQRLKFVAVLRGRCRFGVADGAVELLEAGDVVLLGDTAYDVASGPGVEAVDGTPFFDAPGQDILRVGEGSETVRLGGGIVFEGAGGAFLLEALPRFLRIPRGMPEAASVSQTLERLAEEGHEARPGSQLVVARLAELLLIEGIRAYVLADRSHEVGWIGALADRRIGAALHLLHGDVARRWTVGELAEAVGMSRSSFAARFGDRVGRTPLDYLTHWRMVLARRQLSEPGACVAQVAERVGYSSQSAFAQAFKRTLGQSPREAGRGAERERPFADRPTRASRPDAQR